MSVSRLPDLLYSDREAAGSNQALRPVSRGLRDHLSLRFSRETDRKAGGSTFYFTVYLRRLLNTEDAQNIYHLQFLFRELNDIYLKRLNTSIAIQQSLFY